MDLKYLKSVGLYVLSALLSVAIIAYVVYQAVNGFSSDVETMLAEEVVERYKLSVDAYIMREETIVYAAADGGVNYLYDDGQKVGVNTVVANIYGGGSTSTRNDIIELDRKISILENSNLGENIVLSDTSVIDSRINELYNIIKYRVQTGDIDYALRKKDELLTQLNKRQIIVRNVTNYNDRITLLENQKDRLSSSLENIIESVTANSSGYFFAEVDGYENIFSSSNALTMTLDEFEAMKESEPDQDITYNAAGYGIGKITTNYKWYIACETTKTQLRNFRESGTYTVIFPYSNDAEISMKLERIVQQVSDDRAVLVFSTGTLLDNFNFLRRQTVEIVQNSYTGYKVPISVVRIVDGRQGVYILDGNYVDFKEIEPLIESNGFFIVDLQDKANDEEYYKKLGLYDLIIIKGKDLYEGKIIS